MPFCTLLFDKEDDDYDDDDDADFATRCGEEIKHLMHFKLPPQPPHVITLSAHTHANTLIQIHRWGEQHCSQ